jgi:YD repeat-containing protein
LRLFFLGASSHARRIALSLIACAATAAPAASQNNPFNSDGFPAARGTYGSFPYERVDPLSGNLIVSVTDLSLPGPIPLTVSRSYNSKFHKDFEHNDQSIDEWSPVGVGWRLHFGRVLRADDTMSGRTVIEGTDGGGGALYQTSAYPEGWITKGFTRYNRMNHTAKAPNGVTYTFGHIGEASGPRGQVRYLTAITDQFGNAVTFTYAPNSGRVTNAHQVLNASQSRDVNFAYNGNNTLATITYTSPASGLVGERVRVWTFQYDPAPGASGHSVLRKVIPPAGLPWEHVYANNGAGPEMMALIAPGGGRVDFTYSTQNRRSGALNQPSRVVATRTVSGPNVTGGTWTFTYNQGANLDTTVVACPCGTTTYRYNGIGLAGNFNAWAMGTLAERKVLDSGTGAVLEQETLTYVSSEPISADSIPGEGGQWSDPDVFIGLTSQSQLTRGPHTWTTTYAYNSGLGNYNDFGRPYQVTATGELTRITRFYYQYGFTPWIIGGVSSLDVRVGTSPANAAAATPIVLGSTTYNLSTGFVTATTKLGVVTQYTANSNGTVASVTNANSHTTQLLYDWGVVADTRNPIVWTARGIYPDGTTASTTVGNDPNPANNILTTYEYDLVGRPTYVRPRNANFTRYTYDDWAGNSFVYVERGASQTTTYLDGFGRPTGTVNQVGVRTRIDRDACGRVTYASGTYTAGNGLGRGATTTYDGLGRVVSVSVTDPSGSPAVTAYSYVGADVTITDAGTPARTTTYDYSSFGGPGDARLIGVLDANGKTTSYTYDTLGNLTQVLGPGPNVPARTWNYHATTGRLTSEVQPESGTTIYTYDALGNVKTVTDQAQRITRFTYDNDERLTQRATDGDTTSTVNITYDLVGRVSQKTIPGVVTNFTFDNVGRIATRSDGIHPGMNFASSYFYDGNSNVTEIRYPCIPPTCTQPRSVRYEYDAENRLKKVWNDLSEFAKDFTYDDAGRLATYQTGAVTHRFDYDIRDRIKQLRAGPGTNYGLDLTYSYDKVSQVTGIVDGRPGMYGLSQSFGYDALYRLTGAAGPWGLIAWSYDNAGNRLTEERSGGGTTYYYDWPTNRLTSTLGQSNESFSYTAVGEVASDSRGTYSYTPTGRLANANGPGLAVGYMYDPDLMRVKKSVNNVDTITVRGAGGQVLTEAVSRCGGSLEWGRDNIYAGGKLIGAVRNSTEPHKVDFVWPGGSLDEGFGAFGMGVRIITGNLQPLPCPVTVAYEFVPSTATKVHDFTGTDGTLTFPAGTASGAYLGIGSTLVNDPLDEADETYWVQLTGANGAVLSTNQRHVITIVDNDPPPSVSVNDITVNETQGIGTFTATLSTPSAKTVSVYYSVNGGSATIWQDYLPGSSTITFAPGQLAASIPFTILNDSVAETPETVNVTLSSPVNVTIADGTGVATINSDEEGIDPSMPGRYFPEVESSTTEAGYLLIFNPHTTAVTAKLSFIYANGNGVTHYVSIPAQKRFTYDLAMQAVGNSGRFSAVVQTTDATKPLVSEHSGYSGSAFQSGRNDIGSVPAPTWYFGEGVSNGFFDETITIFNPTNTPVSGYLKVFDTGGGTQSFAYQVPTGPGRTEIRVNNIWAGGDHGTSVTAVVNGTSTPANVVVQRTLRWPIGAIHETSTASGSVVPHHTWYFGEGGKGAWSTFLSFMNPSASQTAESIVYYVHDNGQTYTQNVTIAPQRRVTVSPPASMPDGGFAIHTGSYNYVPYVVERSTYLGANFALGASSAPTTGPAGTWRFAEGASNGFFDTFFAVFNPNWTSASTVTMTFRKDDNTVATHSFTVGARQRVVVSPDALPLVNGTTYATEVTTTNGVGIVVERAMYWPQGGWNGSHLSLGVSQ